MFEHLLKLSLFWIFKVVRIKNGGSVIVLQTCDRTWVMAQNRQTLLILEPLSCQLYYKQLLSIIIHMKILAIYFYIFTTYVLDKTKIHL